MEAMTIGLLENIDAKFLQYRVDSTYMFGDILKKADVHVIDPIGCTGAMSQHQRAAMMQADEGYFSSRSFKNFDRYGYWLWSAKMAMPLPEGVKGPSSIAVKLKSLLDKYKRPKNVGNLLVPRVNEVIWNEAGPLTRARDIRMQHTQGMITKAIVPITEMKDELMTAVANRQQVNAIKMIDKTNNSLRKLIGYPNDSYLFGDDLPKSIKDITECKELSNKLHTPGKSAMHRGSYTPGYRHRNPGNRFRPYDPQRLRKGGFVKNKGFQSVSDRGRTGNHRNQGPFLGRRPSGPKPHHRKY
ncbi:uncharacterized protein LOC125378194 [Haliotis rufescens]|uniref:uncharacterized protein LOC125378194 n=1 Tax=Haliotis rufescens TaxID=6454 RepID=UPI00201EDB75|nr:uncharacterized protein LOC125378194 [Haliotis rufescens]